MKSEVNRSNDAQTCAGTWPVHLKGHAALPLSTSVKSLALLEAADFWFSVSIAAHFRELVSILLAQEKAPGIYWVV